MHQARRNAYLSALGVTQWRVRDQDRPAEIEPAAEPASLPVEPMPVESVFESNPGTDMGSLQRQVASCRNCSLCESRSQTVFGAGSERPRLMIIGEAPGVEEDKCGEPFVGNTGHLLDNILRAMGLDRAEVFITNVVKCRPAGNRNPGVEELKACSGYLDQQINLLQPRVILALGAVSAHSMLQVDTPVSRLRGVNHVYGQQETPLLVTYHPAYLLRKPSEKAKVWADLQVLMGMLH